jgi:hypothetical protein
MTRGRFGGRSRRLFSSAPYNFARKVHEVIGTKKSSKRFLLDARGTARVCYEIRIGADDHCFILPATELMSHDLRDDNAQILARGGGIHFDVLAHRSYSVRVLAFRHRPNSVAFAAAETGGDGAMVERKGTNFGPIGATGGLPATFLLGDDGLLSPKDGVDPIYYPVSDSRRRCVYLDKTIHGRPSQTGYDVRPVDAWVPMMRKVKLEEGKGFGRLARFPEGSERDHDFYFAVIIHIPCFTHERIFYLSHLAGQDDHSGSEADVKMSDTPRKGKGSTVGNVSRGVPLRPTSSGSLSSVISEAETIRLGSSGTLLPAVEIRNVSSRFYWREVGE